MHLSSPDNHTPDHTTLGFPLMAAIAKQDVQTVRALFAPLPPLHRRRLANFRDYDDRRPLHIACAEGLLAIARELLNAGADPTAVDRYGASCVQTAILNGRLETLRLLGEFPKATFPGPVQPTHVDPRYALGRDLIAVSANGNVSAAKQLVRHFGANVNFANADGRTPLHMAVVRGDVGMVSYLLEAGADMHRKDRWHVSPAEEAAKGPNSEVADLMVKLGRLEEAILPPELASIVEEAAAFAVC